MKMFLFQLTKQRAPLFDINDVYDNLMQCAKNVGRGEKE